jgi:ribonuclease HII
MEWRANLDHPMTKRFASDINNAGNYPTYPSLRFEQDLWKAGFFCIAGIDEAGRGAWAGPVCAAAVILPPEPSILQVLYQVRDSKLMTPLEREIWAPRIRETAAAWGVGFASNGEIDTLGILPATKLAATRAISALTPARNPLQSNPGSTIFSPDHLLTDFLVLANIDLPQTALVKGDRLSLSISAASILAKTSRDALMREMDEAYPGYNFSRHKGYGTTLHRSAIRQMGLCEIHRKSFSIHP